VEVAKAAKDQKKVCKIEKETTGQGNGRKKNLAKEWRGGRSMDTELFFLSTA